MGFAFSFIHGVSVGFEYSPDDGMDDEVGAILCIDLLIIRLMFATMK